MTNFQHTFFVATGALRDFRPSKGNIPCNNDTSGQPLSRPPQRPISPFSFLVLPSPQLHPFASLRPSPGSPVGISVETLTFAAVLIQLSILDLCSDGDLSGLPHGARPRGGKAPEGAVFDAMLPWEGIGPRFMCLRMFFASFADVTARDAQT
jgi:hypothetical protein